MFEPYLSRWELVPDGEAIVAHSSRLLPVLYRGEKTMLKIAVEAEEKRGGLLMLWWDGDDAARVLEHEDDALLLERATGTRSLEAMARDGRDDEASRIICAVAA
ncbi:MAG TPA: aminoglycoside phosphotransferase family protein, partial [Methyloceanibacter sp.]|nr:aminoglycoside phosphotransferase family protein [Methyloceanibacter sp.]